MSASADTPAIWPRQVVHQGAQNHSTGLDLPELSLAPGQRVITLLGAANRDPRVFDEPDAVRLDRS